MLRYKNGCLHRDGDLPAVISGDREEWWVNDKRHREGDLPALINGNYSAWFRNGELHREGDLPAVIDLDSNRQEWYKEGIKVSNNLAAAINNI